ncbi:terminase gpP N-terminus-related DNA-binding protein [Segatella buccae]|uniref:terminase gpP N-terminus-related DNA-binding protein n=1 Tax=Segatella buccae TaxID=28126 RepID=UPI0022DF1B14|nr:YfeC-like transcriptional regulator [Segatella buccae]
MKKTIDKKGIAKSLYLDGNYTQEEIADKVGTTRQTVSRWVKAENWEEIKASVTITPAQIIAQWNRQIVEINKKINARPDGERFATTQEADALSKLAGSIKKLEADIGVPDCVSVAMRFLSWLRPLDIEAAKQFNNLFDAFIKDQAAGTKS